MEYSINDEIDEDIEKKSNSSSDNSIKDSYGDHNKHVVIEDKIFEKNVLIQPHHEEVKQV